ncbi:MAG TPA: GntR family transcriptional regulator, partial [Solirubrobacterales bacterium]
MSSNESISLPVPRVKKAYEQVAEQLRDLMHRGVISSGDRLPSETALAKQFGISRSTVREALRRLSAEDLIVTRKGAQGGSFVTLPSVDNISGFVSANINLLTASDDVSLEEFLEARELLEVPAARLAAARSSGAQIGEVEDSIPADPGDLNTEQLFVHNRGFHSAVIEASCNTLLVIAAQPIMSVLQTNLAHSTLSREFHETI